MIVTILIQTYWYQNDNASLRKFRRICLVNLKIVIKILVYPQNMQYLSISTTILFYFLNLKYDL